MNYKALLVILVITSCILSTSQAFNGGHQRHIVIKGTVVSIIQDDEGANIVIDSGGGIKTVYVPRSNLNEGVIRRAVESQRTKSIFKVAAPATKKD